MNMALMRERTPPVALSAAVLVHVKCDIPVGRKGLGEEGLKEIEEMMAYYQLVCYETVRQLLTVFHLYKSCFSCTTCGLHVIKKIVYYFNCL